MCVLTSCSPFCGKIWRHLSKHGFFWEVAKRLFKKDLNLLKSSEWLKYQNMYSRSLDKPQYIKNKHIIWGTCSVSTSHNRKHPVLHLPLLWQQGTFEKVQRNAAWHHLSQSLHLKNPERPLLFFPALGPWMCCEGRETPMFDLCQSWFPAEEELCLRRHDQIKEKVLSVTDRHLPEI